MERGSFEYSPQYLEFLHKEKELCRDACPNAARLLALEIDRIQSGHGKDKMLDLHEDKPTNLSVKIRLPEREFPQVNFAGRIIGTRGAEMKRFQDNTGVRLFVCGRGSMSDKKKEEELRQSGGKYEHLNEDLHAVLQVFAKPAEAYKKMSVGLTELRAYMEADDPPFHTNFSGVPGPDGVPQIRGNFHKRPAQPSAVPQSGGSGAPNFVRKLVPIHGNNSSAGSRIQFMPSSSGQIPTRFRPHSFGGHGTGSRGARSGASSGDHRVLSTFDAVRSHPPGLKEESDAVAMLEYNYGRVPGESVYSVQSLADVAIHQSGPSWGAGVGQPYATSGQYRVHPYGRFPTAQLAWGQSHQY